MVVVLPAGRWVLPRAHGRQVHAGSNRCRGQRGTTLLLAQRWDAVWPSWGDPMTFGSILFERAEDGVGVRELGEPTAFKDLNLDQVVAAVTLGREEYELAPFFYSPLRSAESIAYRHEILRDLDGKVVADDIESFARRMRSARQHLGQARKLYYQLQKERWFLSAAENYCAAVNELADALSGAEVKSRGLVAFRDYLIGYAGSRAFELLVAETAQLTADLLSVRYRLQIRGDKITVSRYDGEADYSAEIEQTFARFKQGAVKDYRVAFRSSADMNHVEAGILGRVAKLFPDIFSALHQYCDRHGDFIDATVATFDREVQFYLAYLEYLEPFKAAELTFCYPAITDSKNIHATATFDLALANKLVPDGVEVVCNDFRLTGRERIFVVTGPNQGGKTTFARTVGQLHHLAALGLPVPGDDARMFLFDRLFTHFEKEEDLKDLRGKLQDDLLRIHDILEQATGDSIVIMNEIFTSTTLQDAVLLGRQVLEKVVELDLLCVCVTFVDELASLSETTVSMVSTVDPADLAVRTYKVIRKPADGLAYAAAIAAKYRLSYELLKGRLNP
jgi:DNA mismatch repair protein MutS